MSFLRRLFGRPPQPQGTTPSQRPTLGLPDLVQLSGTTTNSRLAIVAVVARHDPDDTGCLEIEGVLQREPDNAADPKAVAVHIEGERVGYLPGYVAAAIDLSPAGARPVAVQIFTQLLEKGVRAEAWAWIGEGDPRWAWTEQKRPPLSPGAKVAAKHGGTDAMVADALAGGGERATQFRAGMVDGVHYLQMVEPIKHLKREGRLEDALVLCMKAIEAAESSAKREKTSPPPFYTEQAAIVLRKLGRRDEEIAVLNRYVDACPPKYRQNRIKERLDKLLAG
ncbi:HIRAN domain-containing protein [Microbacterium aurantiacum]|nr:HIRAN domain-containing protein [Microbacterium chocolatum]ANG84647.1 hypothetical protein A8L33_03935 [Microbacterium chocolatum]